jgi:TonB family protein
MSAQITGVDQVPRIVKTVAPVMPPEAIDADLIGDVTVELLVSTEGRVISAKVLRSPHALLSVAVVKAMHQWVFSPLVEGGKPREFVVRQTYGFHTEP